MNILLINCSPVKNGATAEIIKIAHSLLKTEHVIHSVCIDDYTIQFCKGCKTCHKTAKCIQSDDVPKIIAQFEWADCIICVSPSYWADIPGQFKVFIDRCTPWCNTHEPHATINGGKKGYTIALRTGSNIKECHRIIESIEHFYGHLEITPSKSLGLCLVESKQDAADRQAEIEDFLSILLSKTP